MANKIVALLPLNEKELTTLGLSTLMTLRQLVQESKEFIGDEDMLSEDIEILKGITGKISIQLQNIKSNQ